MTNLSSITSGLDLQQIPPIHQKRIITFINHFVITTVNFLNKFFHACESRLQKIDSKMQKLEAHLCIIEAKLNSIPGLENVIAQTATTGADETDKVEPTSSDHTSVKQDTSDPPPSDISPEDGTVQSEASSTNQNPELVRFYKMVQFGVPVEAVKLKMKQEGFDPSLLVS